MKTKRGSLFLLIVIAILPLLAATQNLKDALVVGSAVALGVLLTGSAVPYVAGWLPRRVRAFSQILWIAVLVQATGYLVGLSPWWGASVYLLCPRLDAGDPRSRRPNRVRFRPDLSKDYFLSLLIRAAGFWILALYLGLTQEILGGRLLIWTFRGSAGALLLLGLAAFFWQNQPYRESEEVIPSGSFFSS